VSALPQSDVEPFAELSIGKNRVALLRDGTQTYPAMLRAIAAARSTICLESYIFEEDEIGQRFAQALIERARAGVEVNLMVDAFASPLGGAFLRELSDAGVRVVHFGGIFGHRTPQAMRWRKLFSRLWHRDHRKLLTVDGEVGFTGGLNIDAAHADVREGGAGWRDTDVRIVGPAAADLQQCFLGNWRRQGGPDVDARRYAPPEPGDGCVRIVANELALRRRDMRKEYLRAIRAATKRIWITQGYFLPPLGTRMALRKAARRGVDVRVILGGTTDVKAVLYASRALYGGLLAAGARLFEWRGTVLHAKTAVIDGRWGTVGSTNFDYRSWYLNLELNAVIEDEKFGAAVELLFERDLPHCHAVTLAEWRARPWLSRILSGILYWFRDWL
jgi:cardiolipin synthase